MIDHFASQFSRPATRAFMLISALLIGACSQQAGFTSAPNDTGDASKKSELSSFANFPDIPLPSGAKMDVGKSLVFGAGESWFGRLTMTASTNSNGIFDFFKAELPKFGWTEITSVRSSVSVLTFSRDGRIATIQIKGATLQGSEAIITVSPRHAPAAGGGAMPAPVQPRK